MAQAQEEEELVNNLGEFDKSRRILVFASDMGINILSKCDRWHVDGTFHTASKYFGQLYIIQGWYKYRMIPVAWILMKKRKFKDYKKVLGKIKEHAIHLNLELNPKSIMTDMEIGAMKAFKYFWTSALILACLLHVGQAWFKYFSKLGFKTLYGENDQIRKWFQKVFAMTLIPPSAVDEYWEDVIIVEYITLKDTYPKLTNFIEYIINNYFEGSFPKSMWNHFETVGNRTNNHLEGYNKKLKNFMGAKSPNIFKSVHLFQEEELNATLKFLRADDPDGNVNRPPRRAHLDIVKEAKIKTLMDLVKEKELTLKAYVEKVISFYDFNRDKLKRMEEDEEESDDISSSDDEEEDD